jgi:hypothetical protein
LLHGGKFCIDTPFDESFLAGVEFGAGNQFKIGLSWELLEKMINQNIFCCKNAKRSVGNIR